MEVKNKYKRLQASGDGGEVPASHIPRRISRSLGDSGDLDRCGEQDSLDSLKHLDKIQYELGKLYSDKRITIAINNKLQDLFGEVSSLVQMLVLENYRLKGKLEELETNNVSEYKLMDTFAEKVKSKVNETTGRIKDNKSIIIRGKNELSSDEVKRRFFTSMDPRNDKIRIVGVRKLRTNGLMVNLAADKDRDKILNLKVLDDAGLDVQVPIRKKPRMILLGVPKEITAEDLIQVIYSLNSDYLFNDKTDYEEFKLQFKLLYQTGRRREFLTNWVVEVAPSLRYKLLEINRLFIEYRSCYIKDYYEIPKCFKCQLFGHVAKFCRNDKDVCFKCGVVGHRSRDCTKQIQKICIPCRQMKKSCSHISRSGDCFSYQIAISRYKQLIDYG
ncbi:uncharacterized protein LOC111634912 [Centruroides sculpturatus]|uniref:uncharacterized protein LOC111634912 n=1 Tax=Centruroides sculpturatus TaxID=218467 RepID=UPI000C6CE4BB|nr:uncharacterized protein LOC111634912 [Centruroides sculpturatus]